MKWGCRLIPGLALAMTVPAQDAPTFRTDARLVELQVVVTARGNQPVAGLTEEDFTVLENGKPKRIAFFSAPSIEARLKPGPLPAGLHTNRPEYSRGAPRGVTAIVLDLLNTGAEAQFFARSQVARFLKGLREDDLVALYVLGDRLRVIHDFTDDPRSLLQLASTLRNEWPAGQLDLEQQVRAEADLLRRVAGGPDLAPGGTALKELERTQGEMRSRVTLQSLEMLGQHLAGIPGRKALVWVSSGVSMYSVLSAGPTKRPGNAKPASRRWYEHWYERAASQLVNANVAVYPVDARGLRIDNDAPLFAPDLGRTGAYDGGRGKWLAEWRSVFARETFSAMNFIAESTGGRALYNSNDIEGGLRRAADDLRVNYTLGYYTSLDDDARRRELQVKVSRRGVEVLARRLVPAASRTGLLDVQDLLASPVAATGVLLNGRVTRSGAELRVVLQIEPGSLLLTRRRSRTEGQVEIYLAQIRPSGQRRVADSRLTLRFTEEQLATVIREGLVYEKSLELDPEAERLRVVVRDARSGAAGSFDAALRLAPEE
jgi:VWFA-related protein